MPVTVSKLKFKSRMADPKRVGRVFCVTGYHQEETSAISQTKHTVNHSDTESNSSGYVSSSSFDSSGEDKRIVPNEHKVFQMWERWSQHLPVPKSSTPKETSTRRFTNSRENLLCIKKNLGKSKVEKQQPEKKTGDDSFWDIELPERLTSSCSVNDHKTTSTQRPSSVPLSKTHDAGSSIPTRRSSDSSDRKTSSSTSLNDWRRRPFCTLSNSESDLVSCGKTRQLSGNSSDGSEYNSSRRYRVKLDSESDIPATVAKRLTEQDADYYNKGVPVDESMTEFISSVDSNNLAGILQFYDHVTSEAAYRKTTRPSRTNVESVYF